MHSQRIIGRKAPRLHAKKSQRRKWNSEGRSGRSACGQHFAQMEMIRRTRKYAAEREAEEIGAARGLAGSRFDQLDLDAAARFRRRAKREPLTQIRDLPRGVAPPDHPVCMHKRWAMRVGSRVRLRQRASHATIGTSISLWR